MKKALFITTATLLTGIGILVVGYVQPAEITTPLSGSHTETVLTTPSNRAGMFSFGKPENHTVTVDDTGLVTLALSDKTLTISPKNVKYDTKSERKDKSASLTTETHSDTALYKGVWGAGSEIKIENKSDSLSKVVSFDDKFLKDVPPDVNYVEVSFDITGWNVPDGTYTNRIELEEGVWLEKAKAWDSSDGDPNQNYTDVEFVVSGNVLTKRIPVEWFKTATFPVYTDAVFTFGTKSLADTGPSVTVDTLKIDTNKFVNCWVDNADTAQEGRCQVATTTGTTISYGTASNYNADVSGSGALGNTAAGACSAGTDRWVVVYIEDANDDRPKAAVASSSGLVVNGYGTATTFDTATSSYPVCTYISTDKVVIAWQDSTNTSGQAVACTINADYTLTCGTTVTFRDTANSFFDFSCSTLDTNKFICVYTEGNATFSRYLTAGTVSGTTITLGTETTAYAASSGDFGHTVISPNTDKFVLHTITTGNNQTIALGTVSGTTITLGATTTSAIATSTSFTTLTSIDVDSAFLLFQNGVSDASATYLSALPIELNFGTLTFSTSTQEQVDTTTDPGSIHAAMIGDCKFAFVWEDDNDTNDLFAIIGDTAGCGSLVSPGELFINNGGVILNDGAELFVHP